MSLALKPLIEFSSFLNTLWHFADTILTPKHCNPIGYELSLQCPKICSIFESPNKGRKSGIFTGQNSQLKIMAYLNSCRIATDCEWFLLRP